jgi:hypothetical protein
MARLPFVFDANQVSPQTAPAKLPVSPPEGWPCVIIGNEFKATKDATPQNPASYLMFTLEIIDGPFKGAKGYDRLNLQHSNQTTVDIAYARLSSYCHVTGVFRTDELDHLMGKPFRIVVEQQEDPRYTQVVAIKDINGNEPGKGVQQQQAAPLQAPPVQSPQYAPPVQQPQPGQWQAPPAAAPQQYAPQQGYQAPPPQETATPGPTQWTPPGQNPPPVAPWQK